MRSWSVMLAIGLGAGARMAGAQEGAPVIDLPAGYGALNQDQISILFTAGDLQVRFLPLDERVLRVVGRDAYESLHGLVVARQAQIDSATRAAGIMNPGLALVSFFALRADARFDPQNLSVLYRNQFYRPVAIVPLTANFSSRQLRVRQQASAIYVFELTLPVFEEFDLDYAGTESTAWKDIVPVVLRERARILSRYQAGQDDSAARKP